MPTPDPAAAPFPQQSAAPTAKPKGAIGIWIGILLIIGGIVLGIVLVVQGARTLIDSFGDLERVPIAEGGVVDITTTGEQTIFAERYTPQGGTSFQSGTTQFSGAVPNVEVQVIAPNGQQVLVTRAFGSVTYVHDHRDGIDIARFDAPQTGRYQIKVLSQADPGPYTTLAVGKWIDTAGIAGILGGVFGGGALVLIGIVVVIIFAVRRSRSKRRIREANNPYGGQGPYGTPPAAGWGTPGAYATGGSSWQPPPAPGWVPPPVESPSSPTPQAPWQDPGSAPPPPAGPGSAPTPPPPTPDPGGPAAPPPAFGTPWQPPGTTPDGPTS